MQQKAPWSVLTTYLREKGRRKYEIMRIGKIEIHDGKERQDGQAGKVGRAGWRQGRKVGRPVWRAGDNGWETE